jgi:hypothetical protein
MPDFDLPDFDFNFDDILDLIGGREIIEPGFDVPDFDFGNLPEDLFGDFNEGNDDLDGGGNGGGGGNFGGGGRGFNFSRINIPDFDVSDFIDPGLLSAFNAAVRAMLGGKEGIPDDLFEEFRNRFTTESKLRERDRLLREEDVFASRNFARSGPKDLALFNVADSESEFRSNSLAELMGLDAQLSAQQRAAALSAVLGIGQLGLGAGNLGLDTAQFRLAELLGQGNLDLGFLQFELERALQELLINLQLRQDFLPLEF